MNSEDIIEYKKSGFDTKMYYEKQKKSVLERVRKFEYGKLYLEVGGKFFYDPHAARVLPGYDPNIKQKILADLIPESEILFCVDYKGIVTDRQLKNTAESYRAIVWEKIQEIEDNLGIKPKIVINRVEQELNHKVEQFITKANVNAYEVYKRYYIKNYPNDFDKIFSDEGFGLDDYIKLDKDLAIVVGPASSSGKMSTCLGQIYLDHLVGIESGYAKFDLFPIWNLPLDHPVNLAYEAATVDIGDYNVIDKLHLQNYGKDAVNYNRDKEIFRLITNLAQRFDEGNLLREYKSPTDMMINEAGFCITDDKLVCEAGLEEINRRAVWYQDILSRGDGLKNWINRCYELRERAEDYIKKSY